MSEFEIIEVDGVKLPAWKGPDKLVPLRALVRHINSGVMVGETFGLAGPAALEAIRNRTAILMPSAASIVPDPLQVALTVEDAPTGDPIASQPQETMEAKNPRGRPKGGNKSPALKADDVVFDRGSAPSGDDVG